MFNNPRKYVYILIREDLPFEEQIMYFNQAAYKAGAYHHEQFDPTPHFILCTIPNYVELLKIAAEFEEKDMHYDEIYERDKIVGLYVISTEKKKDTVCKEWNYGKQNKNTVYLSM